MTTQGGRSRKTKSFFHVIEVDTPVTRRDFIRSVAGTAVALGTFPLISNAADTKRSAVDRVALGKTKIQITRLGMGTGSNGGSIQRKLGEENFVKLIRHGWDRGIRYIDTADNYKIHDLVGKAIKGLPREELVLLSKMKWGNSPDVNKELDRFRKELGVDYLDIVLIHCVTEAGWPKKLQKMCDDLAAAKQAGIVRAVGVSQHSIQALREVAGNAWVDVNLIRVNHNGHHMDGSTGKWGEPAEVSTVMDEVKKIHGAGKGVLGMKLVGNGDFKNAEDREKAIQAVMKSGCVDAVTIGFKSPEEIDEAIERINRALNG
ncbi:MAG: aldo/keto reductase [Kiritimatiellae bacterium]|nr:aldo/keto reductase [Kiritimatiellia bacterium]MDD5519418.1 aldo/keto reductase [Kiritimatiellia bacterium]